MQLRQYDPRVLGSLTNKNGMEPFFQGLEGHGFTIYSTGGTATKLREAGVTVVDVADLTGFPEGMDGRVKTLHPMVHGGLLGRLDLEGHVAFQDEHGIQPIQLVVCNLYDFAGTVADPRVLFDDAVEQIDIGGPSMIRAAAKNYRFCVPVVDPADYNETLSLVAQHGTDFPEEFRKRMQRKAFRMTGVYDMAIADWLDTQAA